MASSLPDSMTAIEISEPGGPEVLKPASTAIPAPGSGEILIKVAAAGVNRPDVLQRKGLYPAPADASPLPGLEVAGTVVASGSETRRFHEGSQVCALVHGGGYAEYCVAHETSALPIPDGLSAVEAACLPETFFTVWTNVFDRGGLRSGETFLVHGGSSGIGTTAIMLASTFGAQVFATAGSTEKCTACENLGADLAINYRNEDFVEATRQATDGRGVDLILDMVGGDYIERNIEAAADQGRIVQIAFLNGPIAEVNFAPLMLKRLTLTGSTLRIRTVDEKANIAQALENNVWPLIEAGRVKSVIHAQFPLDRAEDAHALMEDSNHIGKIVLTV